MSNEQQETSIVTTQTFDGVEVRRQTETAAIAMAEREKALVQASFVMAERNPRSWIQVRSDILDACKRPRFAESARFKKPLGKEQNDDGQWVQKYVEGFSIRFAEETLRTMRNIKGDITTVYEDDRQLIVSITVRDFQTNAELSSQVTVTKTVERKKPKKGQRPISSRTNSYGDTVFLVEATADEVLSKMKSIASKELRTNILRMLPSDIKEDAEDEIKRTLQRADKEDPTGAIKRIADKFAELNVKPAMLAEYLGHEIDSMSPSELDDLRCVYQAMQEGLSWHEFVAFDTGDIGEDDKSQAAAKHAQDLLVKARASLNEKKLKQEQKQQAAAKPAEAKPADDQSPTESATVAAAATANPIVEQARQRSAERKGAAKSGPSSAAPTDPEDFDRG